TRHAVDRVGERFQRIAGVDLDLLVEFACPDTLCAYVEGPYGAHHAARESKGADRGKHQACQEQQRRAHDRRVQLREHLGYRLLDEDVPVQRFDGSHGCEHRYARKIGRNSRGILWILLFEDLSDVRKLRQVGLAQHQPDVGIRHEEAVAIDDISFAFLADLDARHDVPDELEIDVRNGHRSRVVAGTDAYRHVRLGFLLEVDRPEPRLSAFGIEKRGLLRAVLAGVD